MRRPSHERIARGLACCAVLALLAAGSAGAREIHRWVDENGVVHFSDVQPADRETRRLDLADPAPEIGPAAPAAPAPAVEPALSAAEQRRQDIRERREARAEEKREAEYWCDKHRKRLEQMEPARRVFYTDENGEQVRMDDGQRMGLIEESKNYLAENCP